MILDNRPLDFILIREKLNELPTVLKSFANQISAVLLFGSLACEKETPLSDVDLAVLYSHSLDSLDLERVHFKVWDVVTDLLETEDIDLINLNTAPLTMQYGVIKQAKLLVLNNKAEYIDFWDQTVKYYLDFKPLLDECNKELLKALTGRVVNG